MRSRREATSVAKRSGSERLLFCFVVFFRFVSFRCLGGGGGGVAMSHVDATDSTVECPPFVRRPTSRLFATKTADADHSPWPTSRSTLVTTTAAAPVTRP